MRGVSVARKEFILQGFTTRTHGAAVRELFDVKTVKRVLLSVAFVTESGVKQIEERLKPHAKNLTVFAGIRNDISTHQSLKLLYGYGGTLYAVDTGARSIVFHPKLYLVRGEKMARAIIGSANLTLGGLNNNIEAGMLLEFDLENSDDKKIVEKIEKELDGLPAGYPEHILEVTTVKQLDDWLASGRLVDEMAVPPPRPSAATGGEAGASDTVPRIKLRVVALRSALKRAMAAPKKPEAKVAAPAGLTPMPAATTNFVDLELVWESKPLKRRSLNIPTGKNTSLTGSATLGKGMWEDIVPASYFRDDVFGELSWHQYKNRSGNLAETATASFGLVVKNVFCGEHVMKLTHSFTRAAAATTDRNLPTEVSWGTARQFIAKEELIGRSMLIFRSKIDRTKFVIEID
jgi:HKD family nuclease